MPSWPPDPWPTVTVGHPSSFKDPERQESVPEALARQHYLMSMHAHLEGSA